MGAEKHYAGRWICQKPVSRCKGEFAVQGYHMRMPCPLADKCLRSGYERGQLEYMWPMNSYHRLLIQSEPDWDRRHLERRNRALNAFDREGQNAYHREYSQRNPERRMEIQKRCMPTLASLGVKPKNAPKQEEPPCGGDCRNCPYPACRYEDWEGPRAKRRRIAAPSRKAYEERRRERMRTDPKYAERERARARAYVAAYRQRVKDAKKKNEGVTK